MLHIDPYKLSYKQCLSSISKEINELKKHPYLPMPSDIQVQENDWLFMIFLTTFLFFDGNFDSSRYVTGLVEGFDDQQIDFVFDIQTTDSIQISVVQSKSEKHFSDKTLQLIDKGLEYLFTTPRDKYLKLTNQRLVNKIGDVRALRSSGKKIHVDLFYVTQAQHYGKPLPNLVERERKTIIQKWKTEFDSFDIQFIGAEDLIACQISSEYKIPNTPLELPLLSGSGSNRSFIEYLGANGNRKALVASVQGQELIKVIEPAIDWIFSENVRIFLGFRKNSINDTIYKSCTDPVISGDFWFLNNGITFTCNSYRLNPDPDHPKVTLLAPQIVNGCQTTMSLLSAFKAKKLTDETHLLVRILETQDSILVDQITTATNSQNSVKFRDLRSNDALQRSLKIGMLRMDRYYEIKAGEYKVLHRQEKAKIISNEKCGQACLAVKLKRPSLALSSKSTIWQKITPGYDEIFSNTALDLLFCFELHHYCVGKQRTLRKKKSDKTPIDSAITNYAAYHLARIMAYLICKDSYDNSKLIESTITSLKNASTEAIYERARDILKPILQASSTATTVNYLNLLKKPSIDDQIDKALYTLP